MASARRAAGAASAGVAALLVAPIFAAGTAEVHGPFRRRARGTRHALRVRLQPVVDRRNLLAATTAAHHGIRAALTASPDIITHAEAMAHGIPQPRVLAAMMGLGTLALGARDDAARARPWIHAALGAFIVVAYFTLSVQVHENHFFLAVPLLIVAAALRREFAPILAGLSVTFALNLFLLFGFGLSAPPVWLIKGIGIDSTVCVAAINCALLGWFAAILARSCRGAATVGTARRSRVNIDRGPHF